MLTTPGTCSASEAIIKGLRGIDIEVNIIGGQTCGKPHAFTPVQNCGTTYFAIAFQGVNHKGFGDYADGMAPSCWRQRCASAKPMSARRRPRRVHARWR